MPGVVGGGGGPLHTTPPRLKADTLDDETDDAYDGNFTALAGEGGGPDGATAPTPFDDDDEEAPVTWFLSYDVEDGGGIGDTIVGPVGVGLVIERPRFDTPPLAFCKSAEYNTVDVRNSKPAGGGPPPFTAPTPFTWRTLVTGSPANPPFLLLLQKNARPRTSRSNITQTAITEAKVTVDLDDVE